MRETLIVVDMQNDFIDGTLGTKEAQAIVSNVAKKIKEYKDAGDKIYVTQDTHYEDYLDTYEGKHLPVEHCIANTDGWQLNDEVYNVLKNTNATYILKHTFGSIELVNKIKEYISENNIDPKQHSIELIGLCLDVCVISNAVLIKTAFPESNVSINLDCTAAVTPETFNATKIVMKSLQIEDKYV